MGLVDSVNAHQEQKKKELTATDLSSFCDEYAEAVGSLRSQPIFFLEGRGRFASCVNFLNLRVPCARK